MKKTMIVFLFSFEALLLSVITSEAQSSFQNLNFENANVSGDAPATQISASDAFPGWTATGPVWYDTQALSSAMIAINDKNLFGGIGGSFAPLDGNFSAYLAGGEGSAVSLSQNGLVPPGTKSLTVEVQTLSFNLQVTVGGDTISMVPLQTTSTYTVYGGDVSAFAGQVEQLAFTEPNTPNGLGIATIDDIQFSTSSIPEPGAWALILFGAGLLGVARRASFKFKV